jgi:hypothetical protein
MTLSSKEKEGGREGGPHLMPEPKEISQNHPLSFIWVLVGFRGNRRLTPADRAERRRAAQGGSPRGLVWVVVKRKKKTLPTESLSWN